MTAMITGWFWNEMVFDKLEKNVAAFQGDIGGSNEVMLKISELTKERMRNHEVEYKSGISVGNNRSRWWWWWGF